MARAAGIPVVAVRLPDPPAEDANLVISAFRDLPRPFWLLGNQVRAGT
jgi:hypothetical protein